MSVCMYLCMLCIQAVGETVANDAEELVGMSGCLFIRFVMPTLL
jgi:hypothetical protein